MRLQFIRNWWWELFCFAIYLTFAANQLFFRPVTGMADNGDFPKALAHLNVCDPNRERDVRKYVDPIYTIDERCYWDSRLTSSETLFVRILKQAALWKGRTSFPITAAGQAHLSVVLTGLIILLWVLHNTSPPYRFGIPPLLILIFSDVLYVAYLNSFYFDAASMVFLLLTASLAVAAILRPRLWVAIAFGVAGSLLALSKTQHVFTGFLFALLAAWFALRGFRQPQAGATGRGSALCWAVSSVAILGGTFLTLAKIPDDYKAEPLYSLIFYTLLPESQAPAQTINELGLPAEDLQFAGTQAYSPGAPVMNPEWRRNFTTQITYGNLILYYFHHPKVTLRLMGRGLSYFGAAMRPGDIANYQRQDGFPPKSLARRFDFWSNLRSWLTWVFPAHIVILYAGMGMGAFVCIRRPGRPARWALYPLVLVLVASGTMEFLVGVLLDANETARHLFFFHVVTELLIICAFTVVLRLFAARPASV